MSRIDDLIAELCPHGVEYVELGELLAYEQPTKYLVDSTAYSDSYATPVLTAGQTFVLGRTDEANGIHPASPATPVIIFDDFTTAFKWVDFPFKVKSSAMKLLTPKVAGRASLRYVYYVMQTIRYEPQDHARQWIGIYSGFQVPVPPLEVQREIVRILDQFTRLEAELEAELEARRRQYEHYKQSALHFDSEVVEEPLGDLVEVLQGFAFKSSGYVDSGIRIVRISDVQKGIMSAKDLKFYPESSSSDFARYLLSEGDLVMSLSGSVGRVAILSESDLPAALNQRVACLRPKSNNVHTRYLFHLLNTDRFEQSAIASTSGGTVKNISAGWLKDVRIPLPSLEEQERTVSILDKFDALVNDLSSGLPAELAARRKQYEYYRDRLLTFKELAA